MDPWPEEAVLYQVGCLLVPRMTIGVVEMLQDVVTK